MNAPDLHVHSMFSTYDGMGSPQAVVDRAVELGWSAACLTEHGWMGSAPWLYQAAKKAKIKPIIGCEMYVTPEDFLIDGDKELLKKRRHLSVLALNIDGYQNLVAWVNESMQRPAYYNGPRISLDRMAEIAPHGLHNNVVLSGCMGSELCNSLHDDMATALYLESARSLFPNFYIELHNHLSDKWLHDGFELYEALVKKETEVRDVLLGLAEDFNIPVIVTNDSHFQTQKQRKPHIAMLARKANQRDRQTSESFTKKYGYWLSYMRSIESIASTLPSWAEREAIDSIERIVEEADIVLDPLDKFSYAFPRSPYSEPVEEIKRRCKSRLKSMVARHGQIAQERFDYELSAMEEFADYLLIYSDIVRMAKSQGIYTWTRGSAANSLVNYCLKIHEIDPIHYKLLFERFVNPARAKFPDVDIDIESPRQPDVVKMVIEYMEEIEGKGNVRAICTYSTLANRNVFRLACEAAGVPKEKIDEYAKLLPQMIDSGMVGSDEEAYELLREELGIDVHGDAAALFDALGGISQHACAFALGTESRPLSSWVPDYRIGSSDSVVTQYNMKWIEELGFTKADLLKLDTLSIMHHIARSLGQDMEWLDKVGQSEPGIYATDDKLTFEMLRAGATEGVHSMQGKVQRRGCMEVGVETELDLVAVQALYRPGAGARTGTDKSFVNRKHGREDWQSINEFVGEYLDETFGYSIYQEQVMEMGFGMGMSGEEVDDLYKAIKAGKGAGRGARELFDKFEPTFRKYAKKLMPKDEADDLWALWYAMQGYAFNRGHATSYAILALKTAWLKAHYPQEFFIALLDHYPGNPRYLAAALGEGFRFEPPDINKSVAGFSRGSDERGIRVGFIKVAGIGPGAAGELVRNQPFNSVADIKERTNGQRVKAPTIDALRAVGALESLGIEGDKDDATEYRLLGMVLGKPSAFKGCKPALKKRRGGKWEFLGLERGVDVTEGKRFCAKLFWIPPDPVFVTKTSTSGHYNANLLSAVDENGIPFDLVASSSKEHESNILSALAACPGAVVCAEGQIAMPFERGASTMFKLWGVSELWGAPDEAGDYIEKQTRLKDAVRRG